jgi:hypothetical protein
MEEQKEIIGRSGDGAESRIVKLGRSDNAHRSSAALARAKQRESEAERERERESGERSSFEETRKWF